MTFKTAIATSLLALAPFASPALAQSRPVAVETASLIRPVVTCVRSSACRKAVADRLRAIGVKLKDRAWEGAIHLAELAGEIASAVERGYERAELCARIDRVQSELAAAGKLTPEISRELVAIKARLGE